MDDSDNLYERKYNKMHNEKSGYDFLLILFI